MDERLRVQKRKLEKLQQSSKPLDTSEESYEHRSLHDKIEEQKQDDAAGQNNTLKELHDIDVGLLDMADQKKINAEQLKEWEEKKELLDGRNKMDRLKNDSFDHNNETVMKSWRLNSENSINTHLRKGVVVRKSDLSNGKTDLKMEEETNSNECCKRKRKRYEIECSACSQFQGSGLTCIGILPGLGSITDSSDDSDQSCSSGSETNENVKYDLLGKKVVFESKNENR